MDDFLEIKGAFAKIDEESTIFIGCFEIIHNLCMMFWRQILCSLYFYNDFIEA